VAQTVQTHGYCAIAVSEGLSDASGRLIAEMGGKDAFGHAQLGGVGQIVAQLIKDKLGYKYHWALADYLQRAARHIASATDVAQAYAVGRAAVEAALAGKNAVMPAITRISDAPYQWEITYAELEQVANQEKKMPREFITADGFHITDACRRYLLPLIEGEDYPPFKRGMPDYARLQNHSVAKKLKEFCL
ncbi:MAG: diphosphate--fructose-6-phosphate 1-phosphotransferase, partial [Zoogloeaceae bacterium]|jgi:6-phosphofructokinase 1|nr:diphosphate--fructose-6-phosphate 1-phosphotransferase [Zoogloeaceae bacterium]